MTTEHPLDVTELKRLADRYEDWQSKPGLPPGLPLETFRAILAALEEREGLRTRNERLEAVVLGVRSGPGAGAFVSVADLVDAELEREELRARLRQVEGHEDVLMREVARLDAGIRRAEDFCARSTACGAILRAAREAEEVSRG